MRPLRHKLALLLAALLVLAAMPWARAGAAAASSPPSRVLPGIDVLAEQNFAPLRGQRAGLLTNPAGVNRHGVSTLEVLRAAPGVKLVALYGPEHGIYGDEKADVPIADRTDRRTGLPVYSLYGQFRKPTPEMLRGIDVMVVDLQDVGTRSYTYISCLRNVLEACFEQGKAVLVLDRPNPLGGLNVGGPGLEEKWMSYVGAYQVPYVYGLTIGELARVAADTPGWLRVSEEVRRRGRLTVVPMRGWRRSMLWPETGLKWVPTSPGIPDTAAAFGYNLTGLGAQLNGFSHGYGTPYSFRLLNYPGKTPAELAAALRARKIPGLDFQVVRYRDKDGVERAGVYVLVTDWRAVRPTELSFHMMTLAAGWERANPFAAATAAQAELFNKHTGSSAWWSELTAKGAQADVAGHLRRWQEDAARFQQWSKKWWLYPE